MTRLRRGAAAGALRTLNARHPWSHNDAFHPWILANLPPRRDLAIDVGCGRGELLAHLAPRFKSVLGTDADASMRAASAGRCAGSANVSVEATQLPGLPGGADLVTMVAVLHHLDLDAALREVRRILPPNGRFLCVGLARPRSLTDHAWDVASAVTNPIIGYVRHPWVAAEPRVDAFPVKDPEFTYAEISAAVHRTLPGATMRRHLGFRHTIAWTKPAS